LESTTELTPPSDPEAAVSLAREGEAGEFLRNRQMTPARVGRYVLWGLGAVGAGSGAALLLTGNRLFGLAFLGFGGLLVGLGLIQNWLFHRDQVHWPDEVLLHEGGVELVLANGEVRGASWADPDFSISLISRRAPKPALREYRLIWGLDPRIPFAQVSEEGYDTLQKEASANNMDIKESRYGGDKRGTRWVLIRQNAQLRPKKKTPEQIAKEAKEAKAKKAADKAAGKATGKPAEKPKVAKPPRVKKEKPAKQPAPAAKPPPEDEEWKKHGEPPRPTMPTYGQPVLTDPAAAGAPGDADGQPGGQ
jgi:hypothetical protein